MTIPSSPAEALFAQGMAQVRGRDFASAVESFRRVTELDPRHSFAHNNLGSALAMLDRHREAAEAFRRALAIDPNYAQAHFNLGVSLRAIGMRDEAFACLVRAIQIDPSHDEAYYYLSLEHQASGRLNEALACYLKASDLSPNDADVYTALASVLVRLRLADAAVQAFEKALSLDPDKSVARAHLIHRLARDCDWARLEQHQEWIPKLGIVGGPVPPFPLLAFEDVPERHRVRSEKFAAAGFPVAEPTSTPARPRQRPERLKIGYFSADFHDHATMFLAARLFELHAKDRFFTYAYSYGRDEGGHMRQRAMDAFDEFKDIKDLSDREIAELARADGVDIAIDLKGYTENQRMGMFATRPAAIQMTYLGYPGTLGAPFIDYLIADQIVIPPEQRHAYSEKLIYLPHSYQINDDTRKIAQSRGTRADAGLPAERFVFCCFNNSYKIMPAEFDIWAELLEQVEGSILWLLETPGRMETNLRSVLARKGIDPERLIIAPRTDLESHLARLRFADLFLDTFNYNAHTTASDSLWAGVPVITKAGKGFATRVAASLLNAIGLGELVTTSERDYAALALDLATDQAKLAAIRARLAVNRTTMPLFDSALFTRHIELAYDLAFDRFLAGEAPADIHVPEISEKEWRARNDSNVRPSDS